MKPPACLDASEGACDLASYEGFTTAGRFVVEQYPVANKQVIGFAVVDGPPVGGDFGDGVRAPWIERGRFALRGFGSAEHFGRTGLIKTDLTGGMSHVVADGIKEAEGADCDGIGGVFGVFERDFDVGLGAEVVDFVGLGDFENASKSCCISEIAVMEV